MHREDNETEFIDGVLRNAIKGGLLGDDRPLAAFVDTRGVRHTVTELHAAFPGHFVHAFAAKANTLRRALMLVREAGMFCEVASPGELEQARQAGYTAGEIVYDQPVKTVGVLRQVLQAGIGVNLDNFQELDRVAALLRETPSDSRIGIRVNPQVGAGAIDAMSTATATSKFGIALEDAGNRDKLLESYVRHAWLTSLHCHVGSQGCSLELMAAGIRKTVDLAEEINATCGRQQVELVDIGGGLPVNFEGPGVRPTFAAFADALRAAVPELFTGHYRVMTEFGRSIFAKNGFIAARVEYTKTAGGRRIALTHAGAQVATRTVFMPGQWPLRLLVFDASGRARQGGEVSHDVAGPLCFSGDLLAADRLLPRIEPGDWVVLPDTGAYYFSNPFYYNALPAPAVYAVEADDMGRLSFDAWRQAQKTDDMLATIG